jgi:hypothetical protein
MLQNIWKILVFDILHALIFPHFFTVKISVFKAKSIVDVETSIEVINLVLYQENVKC